MTNKDEFFQARQNYWVIVLPMTRSVYFCIWQLTQP
jgi:hypothetical protein